MKTKYFKGLMTLSFGAVLFLSSCLKDARYFDPESVTSNVAELPLSGLANFTKDARTKTGLDTVTFAVGVTAATPPSTPTTITIGVDNSIVTTYNAANPAIVYLPIPTAAYKLSATSITIPAGQNSTLTTVIIDRTQLDPALSYMLPVKILNAGGITISANFGIHYYHIIGNDFAGTYKQDYRRYNVADTVSALNSLSFVNGSATLSPVSPTQFEVKSGYLALRYEVTFTKGGTATVPTYSNFSVSLNSDDIAASLTPSSIIVSTPPQILNYDPVKKTFRFYFAVHNNASGVDRSIIDKYYK